MHTKHNLLLRCRIITVIKLQSKNLRLQADYSVVHLNSFRFIWAPVFIVCTALFLSEVRPTVHCLLHGFLDTHLLIHSWCDIARNPRVGAVIGRRRWFCGRINADEKKVCLRYSAGLTGIQSVRRFLHRGLFGSPRLSADITAFIVGAKSNLDTSDKSKTLTTTSVAKRHGCR